MVQTLKIQTLHCNRCNHSWVPRIVPVQCPRCKSYYWNEPKDFDRRRREYKAEKFKLLREIKLEEIESEEIANEKSND